MQRAEEERGEHDADRGVLSKQRDRDAVEAGGVVVAKSVERLKRAAGDLTAPASPAKAPEISMVTMMVRWTLTPA